MNIKTVDSFRFAGKKALVRVDFNVPLDDQYRITDDSRIQGALPTIGKILKDGGAVILMSHFGRPKGQPVEKYSLKHVVKHLSDLVGQQVQFVSDCIGPQVEHAVAALRSGQVLLIENLRFHPEEEKGDKAFAAELAGLGDIYVNDAFGAAHRAHASTSVIAQFFPGAKCVGYLMAAELQNAEKVISHAARPFTAIMGGAKVSDKIELIERLLEKVDHLIIGGGMAYTFAKAQGGHIGKSLVEEDKLDLARHLIEKAKAKGVNLALPVDSVIADRFSNDADIEFASNDHIQADWMGLDIGPKSIEQFKTIIEESKTILWNGPMGVFELSKFEIGTRAIADAVVEATAHGAFSLIGGGDSAAAVAKFNLTDQVSYVSTGGGGTTRIYGRKRIAWG